MHPPSSRSTRKVFDPNEFETLRESVATTLAKECNSRAVHAFIDGRSDLDIVLWRHAVDLGWLAIALSEEHGGLGLGAAGVQLLCRELGICAAPGAFIPTICGMEWLSRLGGEIAAPLLEQVVAGEASMAIPTLASADSLRLDGKGVTGTIELLAGGGRPFAVVPVSCGSSHSWGLIDLAGDGVKINQPELWDRTRKIIRVTFEGASCAERIDDPVGRAGELLGSLIAIALAADSVGAAQAITEKTIAYLKERVQFNRPIASFQAIKHRAADLVTMIATQENLLLQAVESFDFGSPDAAIWARLAKAGASDAAAFITGDCITLHGGVGHTWEYDPHVFAKRARLNQFLLADNGELRSEAVHSLTLAIAEGRTPTEIFA